MPLLHLHDMYVFSELFRPSSGGTLIVRFWQDPARLLNKMENIQDGGL